MKISTQLRAVFTILMVTALFSTSSATVYTAVANGNLSSPATWGGTAPTNFIHDDQLIIPSGISVTLDRDLRLVHPNAVLDIQGTLSSQSNVYLAIDSGLLSGNGAITVYNLEVYEGAKAPTFSGTMTLGLFLVEVADYPTTAHILVTERLMLKKKARLQLMIGSVLDMGKNATMEFYGGLILKKGGTLPLVLPYHILYATGSTETGPEVMGPGLKDVTVDLTKNTNLGLLSDLGVPGTLSLISGVVILNGHNLYVGGDMAAGGTGLIHSTDSSDIGFNTSTSPSRALRFTQTGNIVRNLIVDIPATGAYLTLGGDMHVMGDLTLKQGRVYTADYDLTLGPQATVTGAKANSYVMTGSRGSVSKALSAGSSAVTYPVGNLDNYAPMSIGLNTGSAGGYVHVGALNDVRDGGLTGNSWSGIQSMVKNTWNVTTDILSGLNMNVTPMWSPFMEINGFDRSSAYVSHYANGEWDKAPMAAATQSGSLWTLTRNNLTSASPFAVFDREFTSVVKVADYSSYINVYPNPATDMINIDNSVADMSNVKMEIVNIMGQVVGYGEFAKVPASVIISELKNGNYMIRFFNDEKSMTKKFIKM